MKNVKPKFAFVSNLFICTAIDNRDKELSITALNETFGYYERNVIKNCELKKIENLV